ncbi:fructose bisphosphate aldolase [Colwellia sp. MSW7]|uniref:fructose-bisphosphate aldolase n=1 Tax=Colwellia maritima TaxID=2912588 RepID=A0ABS9X4H3_9GAMM|nr:fructose bisphosphate aldolase [Colwellia maritima]MCI2284667.1 fructose bisphosphate aldolase [Colwellia maritima]
MSLSDSTMASMLKKVTTEQGFIAALDQSGGSTPKALALYGIDSSEFSNDEQMYDLVHQMRTRIVTNPVFTGERVLGAILFENTLDREFLGQSAAQYLWQEKQVVPFLKVDKGLCDEKNDVQLMKDIPALDLLLDKAVEQGVFGTKMRSVIKLANPQGIDDVVAQQFTIAKQILAKGLIPIIEPEIDINSPEKAAAESLLKSALLKALNNLANNQKVMLKVTLPDTDNFYAECINHQNVIKVVALSGGYTREQANEKVAANHNMIASFSRALTQGLSAKQSDEAFTKVLNLAIEDIFNASKT